LTGPEQILFRRLSVFAGGWTIRAAEQVGAGGELAAPDVLELLGRLVDKSLIIVRKGPLESRYYMLETIRQYSHERLQESAEADAVRNTHLEFFVELAEADWQAAWNEGQAMTLDQAIEYALQDG
jgi:non-specific serine/threonine protein kinase